MTRFSASRSECSLTVITAYRRDYTVLMIKIEGGFYRDPKAVKTTATVFKAILRSRTSERFST